MAVDWKRVSHPSCWTLGKWACRPTYCACRNTVCIPVRANDDTQQQDTNNEPLCNSRLCVAVDIAAETLRTQRTQLSLLRARCKLFENNILSEGSTRSEPYKVASCVGEGTAFRCLSPSTPPRHSPLAHAHVVRGIERRVCGERYFAMRYTRNDTFLRPWLLSEQCSTPGYALLQSRHISSTHRSAVFRGDSLASRARQSRPTLSGTCQKCPSSA